MDNQEQDGRQVEIITDGWEELMNKTLGGKWVERQADEQMDGYVS